jgi:hypothetical protein
MPDRQWQAVVSRIVMRVALTDARTVKDTMAVTTIVALP